MAVGEVMQYLVVVHRDRPDGSCGVTVPDLPGCFSAGDTLADALQNAAEAIALHVEGMLTDGEPVPPPSDTIEPDGGIVAAVTVDDGLMSERAVRVNVTLPSRLLALIDRVAKRTKGGRSGPWTAHTVIKLNLFTAVDRATAEPLWQG